MYRIRLASGEEAVYRTVQELAAAVASGMVSPTAEVYHKAANRWLPINTHPDYRAAMSTGTQTAINPAISIPMTPGKGSPAISLSGNPSGKSPAIPVTPSGQAPAAAVNPSGKSPAITLPPATEGGPSPTPPKAPAATPSSSTVRSTALPPEPPAPLSIAPEATRQSAAIPIPAKANTAKASAIPPSALPLIEPEFPAEVEMFDLTAPEPPIALPQVLGLPPVAAPRFPGLDRGKLVLFASIAALVVAVGVTGLILLKSRPRHAAAPDSTQQAAGLVPSPAESLAPVVDSSPVPPSTKPAATAVPVRVARPVARPDSFPAPSRPLPAPVSKTVRDTTSKPVAVPPKPKAAGTSRTPSYYQAYADARSEMDESLAYVSFRRVFAPIRFASGDSLRATKRMVVAAGNILRVYRGREVMLEQTYHPDDPGGRNSLREPFETAEASRSLLSDVDSLFSLLVNQEGEVTVTEQEIRFRSARTARAYNDIRREISRTLTTWRDSAEASNRVTMPRLVQALGGTLPPMAR